MRSTCVLSLSAPVSPVHVSVIVTVSLLLVIVLLAPSTHSGTHCVDLRVVLPLRIRPEACHHEQRFVEAFCVIVITQTHTCKYLRGWVWYWNWKWKWKWKWNWNWNWNWRAAPKEIEREAEMNLWILSYCRNGPTDKTCMYIASYALQSYNKTIKDTHYVYARDASGHHWLLPWMFLISRFYGKFSNYSN